MTTFDDVLRRFHEVMGTRTQKGLADALGIRWSSVSDAARRGAVPPGWYMTALEKKRANPEWIKTGKGPRRVPQESPGPTGTFKEIYDRIRYALNAGTQIELSERLEVRPSAISDAKRKDIIPPEWYLILLEVYDLNPEWVRTGEGKMYFTDALR